MLVVTVRLPLRTFGARTMRDINDEHLLLTFEARYWFEQLPRFVLTHLERSASAFPCQLPHRQVETAHQLRCERNPAHAPNITQVGGVIA